MKPSFHFRFFKTFICCISVLMFQSIYANATHVVNFLSQNSSISSNSDFLTIQNKKISSNKDENYLVVAQDGSGDFTQIQAAINSVRSYPAERITIFIKNGIYFEKVKVPAWNPNISLIGESKDKTIIRFNDHFEKINLGRNSTFYTSTLLVEGNDFRAENLTIENSAGDIGQAVSLHINANRILIKNCNLLGNQDTLFVAGEHFKNYFKDCYIEGTTDFIFGNATAFFDNCTLYSKKNSYITAASTVKENNYGFVFKNCKLTSREGVNEVYLGRPWRIYAKTVFIQCSFDRHIVADGWHNWSKKEAEKTVFYAEYNCFGPGFRPESRVKWARQLTKKQARFYHIDKVLKDGNTNWYLAP